MCRKLFVLVSVVLVLTVANGAWAARWTGDGDGTSWYDADNWSDGNVPGQSEEVDINCVAAQGPVIDSDVECGIVRGPAWEYESDCEQAMNIINAVVKFNGMWRFAEGVEEDDVVVGNGLGTVNIIDSDVTVGGDWRWADIEGDYGIANVIGGSVTCPRLKVGDNGGGELNISGGATVTVGGEMDFKGNAASSLTVDGGSLEVGVKLQLEGTLVKVNLDAGTIHCATLDVEGAYAIDINDGVLIIDGNVVPKIKSDIANDYITAYDDTPGSEVHVAWTPEPNQTTVWATTVYTWARNPSPENNAKNLCPGAVVLSWTPGVYAAEHDVYFGTDYNDVKNAITASSEYRLRQEPNSYDASLLETLEPGGTYYWRIDEVNDNPGAPSGSPWKGRVWSFTINDGNAFDPDPAYNETGVPLDAILSWSPGCSAASHDVYFGTAYEEVRDAATTSSVYKGNQELGETSYDPCDFDYLTVYYWRIDEVNGPTTWKGDVWKFRSQSAIVNVNMLVWYKFDETDGMTANDSSGYEKHAAAVGTTSVDWDPNGGRFDGCIHFTEEEALMPPSDTLSMVTSAITVSVWFNIDPGKDFGDDFVIFDTGDLGSDGTYKLTGLIPDAAQDVVWRAGDDACDVLVWSDATPGAWKGDWHHFAFRKNETAGTMGIFFDGLPRESRTGTNSSLSNVVNKPIILGAWNDENSGDYGGRMDDFRVYNRALSDGEIAELYRGEDVNTAWAPQPYDGEPDVARDVVLKWRPGNSAASHNVYFGTDWDDVNDANTSSSVFVDNREPNEYDPPGNLELDTTCYWRIDEVNEADANSPWKGNVWMFAVANFLIVDDMESYCTGFGCTNEIYDTWIDGYAENNNTGSEVVLGIDPYEPVHGGKQSMVYVYDNADTYTIGLDYYSEVEREFAEPCNWTEAGVKILTLFFYGGRNNDANATEQMYVGLEDSTGAGSYADVNYGLYGEDVNDIKKAEWHQWDIALSDFTGVDANNVAKVYIGIGIRGNPNPGGTPGGNGTVYFDNIRLYLPKCVPWRLKPAADFTDDCIVNLADVGEMARKWLKRDLYFDEYTNPGTVGLVGWWKLNENGGSTANDSSPSGTHDGTISGDYEWVVGYDSNSAVKFSDGKVLVPDAVQLKPPATVSATAWIYYTGKPSSSSRIVVKGRNDAESYCLEADDDDSLTFYVGDVNGVRYFADSEEDDIYRDNWLHLAGTYDGDTSKLYINGEVVATNDEVNSIPLSQDTNDLAIGNKADANDNPFKGTIDDVRVYNRALTAAEVAWLASNGTGFVELNLPENLFGGETPEMINFRDLDVLLDSWLEERMWPE